MSYVPYPQYTRRLEIAASGYTDMLYYWCQDNGFKCYYVPPKQRATEGGKYVILFCNGEEELMFRLKFNI